MTEPDAALPEHAPPVIPIDDATLRLIDLALEEDRGPGDWTTRWTVPARTRARARIVAKQEGVIAGIGIAAAVYQRLDPRVKCDVHFPDGAITPVNALRPAGIIAKPVREPAYKRR